MGIYIFKKKFLLKLFNDNPDATDFGKEIIPRAIEGGYKVASFSYDDYWTDIGTIRSFFTRIFEACPWLYRGRISYQGTIC